MSCFLGVGLGTEDNSEVLNLTQLQTGTFRKHDPITLNELSNQLQEGKKGQLDIGIKDSEGNLYRIPNQYWKQSANLLQSRTSKYSNWQIDKVLYDPSAKRIRCIVQSPPQASWNPFSNLTQSAPELECETIEIVEIT